MLYRIEKETISLMYTNRTITRKIRLRRQIMAFAIIGIFTIGVASAWATVSFVKPSDVSHKVEVGKKSDIPTQITQVSKTRAPEPATMALFGSGFLGMIVSFIRRTYALAKRAFDVTASIIGLVLFSPLLLCVALFIKITSKGPIMYSQLRVGKNGKFFKIYKFRTMKVDAEKDTGPVWAAAKDDRLSPIGGFLRKTHIDEIPQLVNVIKGEMSIIGPRPERPIFVKDFKTSIKDYEKRTTVKPGITGLAQVWYRYDESIEDVKNKLKYDLLYIRKICFWADFAIALRTCRVIVTGEGAR